MLRGRQYTRPRPGVKLGRYLYVRYFYFHRPVAPKEKHKIFVFLSSPAGNEDPILQYTML